MRKVSPSQTVTRARLPDRGALRSKSKGRIFGTILCPMRAVPITALSSRSTQMCSSGSLFVMNSRIFLAMRFLLSLPRAIGSNCRRSFSCAEYFARDRLPNADKRGHLFKLDLLIQVKFAHCRTVFVHCLLVQI